jgi:L-rhamnose isomerase
MVSQWRNLYATRFNSFRRTGDVHAILKQIAAIPGLNALELNYPEHLTGGAELGLIDEARGLGMNVTAINLRYDPKTFQHGAFTNPDPVRREQAIDVTLAAVDLAARAGIGHVILWMGPDGFDYPFQVDYPQLWDLEISGFRTAAGRQPNVKVSVEYKPSDPRRFSLIRSMGDSMLAVREVDLPNFGATLDFCHSLMAGEAPAAAAALALQAGKLFGLHLNDGYGAADDGLMVGSVHPRQTLELLWMMRRHGFQGPIYFDTFPQGIDPAAECAANIAEVERMERVLDRIDIEALRSAQAEQNSLAVAELVRQADAE